MSNCSTVFGKQGPQVQILPLRPMISKTLCVQSLRISGAKTILGGCKNAWIGKSSPQLGGLPPGQ